MRKRTGLSGLAVFAAATVAEVWALIQLGGAVGVLWTLVILFAMSAWGMSLVRKTITGFAAQATGTAKKTPSKKPKKDSAFSVEVSHQGLRVLGAILLFVPGLISGAIGAALQIKPIRSIFASLLGSRLDAVVTPMVRQGNRFSGTVIDVDGFESSNTPNPNTRRANRPSVELPNSTHER